MTQDLAERDRQYRLVRESFGIIDRSDDGLIAVRGADRYSWLQGMVSNDVRLLEQGGMRLPACILDATGHLLSDIVIVQSASDAGTLLIDVPGVNSEKIHQILDRFLITEDVDLELVMDGICRFSVQGPAAKEFIHSMDRRDGMTIVAADHTGSGGFDVYTADDGVRLTPLVGEAARELLRIEAGIPRYGVDMDDTTIALEAGLGPERVSVTKGCYVGQEIMARIESRGHTNRALTGLVVLDDDVQTGAKLASPDDPDREIGWITSVAVAAPAANGRTIALGYVRHEQRPPGTILKASTGATVEVAELPFYRS